MELALLVYNDRATSFTPARRHVLVSALSTKYAVQCHRLDSSGLEAIRNARDNAALVAVLGGDGSMQSVARELIGSETALLPLPSGSTNVFARAIGLDNDAFEVVSMLLDG